MQWNIRGGEAYAIIGARSGSRYIPQKNVRIVGSFPLIAYSIAAGKLTEGISRVIVSTDAEDIAAIAHDYGAETPFVRPADIAKGTSVDREFLMHALQWLQEREGGIPEFLALLRPTTPLRDPKKIAEAVALLRSNPEATGLRSAHVSDAVPQKMFAREGPYFVGLFPHDARPEYHGLPRQHFPPSYKANGYVDVLRSGTLVGSAHATYGDRILAFEAPDTGDIDSLRDFDHVHAMLEDGTWEIHAYLRERFVPVTTP